MNDTFKTFLIALVTAVAVSFLIAPVVHKFYDYPVTPAGAQVEGPLGETAGAPDKGVPAAAPERTAPLLEGMNVAKARERYRERGIVIIEEGIREKPGAEPGTILQQRPTPGAALTNMEIRVTVAKSPSGTQVPDVLGQDVEAARSALVEAGFEVPPPTFEASDEEKGTVINQAPNPGAAAAPGSQVHLVAAEEAAVEVPGLRGKSLRKARSLLEEAGLTVGSVRREEHPEIGGGTVLRHSPNEGEPVPPGTAVDLVVVAPD